MNLLDRRTLVDVELLLLAQAKQQAETAAVDERERQWQNFLAVAPEPVIAYVWAIDEDVVDRAAFDADVKRWFERHHPLFKHVLEALDRAVCEGVEHRLGYTQAMAIRAAWSELHYQCALERKPITGGTWLDAVSGGMASERLLAWTYDEAHRAWLTPEVYLSRWRLTHSTDPKTLADAGLHRAELELLSAQGETAHA